MPWTTWTAQDAIYNLCHVVPGSQRPSCSRTLLRQVTYLCSPPTQLTTRGDRAPQGTPPAAVTQRACGSGGSRLAAARDRDAPWGESGEYLSRWGARGENQLHNLSSTGHRITHLNGLTIAPAGASHHDLLARACGVLNYAALIASDVGMPDLAADLRWRQHQVFADTGRLKGDIAVLSLMPLINISRLLTRDGDGEASYDVLTRLYRTTQKREAAQIHGHRSWHRQLRRGRAHVRRARPAGHRRCFHRRQPRA
ncbi:hypothetical protein ACTPOK_38320 [Streptomyces inhibens]|uniref:hypothetical protein n=1 Tax=Streptomyces inhibens TaxID=2293571 RepID=UPI00402A7273